MYVSICVGMFVDAVVMMEVSSANVIKRFGPGRLDNWKEKRDGYLQELQQRKDNRRKAWVCLRAVV